MSLKKTQYYSIIKKYKMIVSQNPTEETEEFKDLLELMSSTLKANKFSSGYTIINKRGDKNRYKNCWIYLIRKRFYPKADLC